jgi:hypothetical protein
MLADAETEGNEHIVSWLPGGRSFRIHNRAKFISTILPKYYYRINVRSFLRQLNLYGFDRETEQTSQEYGAYHHDYFIREHPGLSSRMKRTASSSSTNEKNENKNQNKGQQQKQALKNRYVSRETLLRSKFEEGKLDQVLSSSSLFPNKQNDAPAAMNDIPKAVFGSSHKDRTAAKYGAESHHRKETFVHEVVTMETSFFHEDCGTQTSIPSQQKCATRTRSTTILLIYLILTS